MLLAAGLAVDTVKMDTVLGNRGGAHVKPDANAKAHESLTWKWWPGEFVFKKHWDWNRGKWRRRMNLGRRRTVPPGADVHSSVEQRGPDYRKRLPQVVNFVN